MTSGTIEPANLWDLCVIILVAVVKGVTSMLRLEARTLWSLNWPRLMCSGGRCCVAPGCDDECSQGKFSAQMIMHLSVCRQQRLKYITFLQFKRRGQFRPFLLTQSSRIILHFAHETVLFFRSLLLHLLVLPFEPEDGGSAFHRNAALNGVTLQFLY